MTTKQETFDKVARHLLTQAQKSTDTHLCRYRFRGLMCAAGCLIPDDKYRPDMEGSGVGLYSRTGATGVILQQGHDLKLVQQLQRMHDNRAVVVWPTVLRALADEFNLSSAVVDELEPSFREKISKFEW